VVDHSEFEALGECEFKPAHHHAKLSEERFERLSIGLNPRSFGFRCHGAVFLNRHS
jgi:hypothetical protein